MARKTFRNKFTSDELTAQINPLNAKLCERFLIEKDRKCSDKTIKGYKSDLNMFFTWNLLYNNNKYFPDIKKIEFSDFFNFGRFELKWESSRFSRVRSCLSGLSDLFIKYHDEDYPAFRNIINSVIESLPKVPVRKKTILSEKQVDDLFDYIINKLKKPQEALLLATAISSGMRIAEIALMTTDLIDENNTVFDDVFLETTREIRTKGFGKTGHQINKFFIKDIFLPYYKEWLPIREKIMQKNNKQHDYLFITYSGDPASPNNFSFWVKKWEKFLGVDIYLHCLRHYTVTYLTRIGLTSDFIVEIMGWKTAAMYNLYLDLSAKDRKWADPNKLQEYLLNKIQEENDE